MDKFEDEMARVYDLNLMMVIGQIIWDEFDPGIEWDIIKLFLR